MPASLELSYCHLWQSGVIYYLTSDPKKSPTRVEAEDKCFNVMEPRVSTMPSLHHQTVHSAGVSSTANRMLPSFNHLVSTLGHMGAEHPLSIEQQSFYPDTHRGERNGPLPSPISDSAHPPQRIGQSSFSHILNPIEEQLKAAALIRSTLPPWKRISLPRDAYEMRQGLPGIKALQPRGRAPPAPSAFTPLSLRSTSNDQDLTLAGKPRKRSTQACHRCREMKIKCQVQGSGCITCMRQGLGCTFEPSKNEVRQRRRKHTPITSQNDNVSDSPPAKRARIPSDHIEVSLLHGSYSAEPLKSPSYSHQRIWKQDRPGPNHRIVGSFPPTPPAETDVKGQATTTKSPR